MVEIIRYEKADKAKVKGYVDVRVPIVKPAILVIRKIAYINNGNKKFFNLPSFTRDANQAKPKYERYFEFETPTFNSHLLDSLHESIKEYFQQHNICEDQPNFAPIEEDFGPVPF
jgi:hypothetical protein